MKAPEPTFRFSATRCRAICYAALAIASAAAAAGPSGAADTGGTPLNYFLYSYGPASRPTMYLGWLLAGLSLAICLLIGFLLTAGILRKRPGADSRIIGREGDGLRWIYIGTGISTGVLVGLVIYFLIVLNAVAKPSEAPALALTVTGYDWWWKVEYEHPDPASRFVTANEIHIPLGQPVLLKLKSADVIHAFWVPTLAGKTQMIPGLINQKWIQADVPGIYSGQCAQFCGVAHAHMGLEVIAESREDFQKWQEAQRETVASALPHLSPDAHRGYKLFMELCSGCHTVRGTKAKGEHGPDLTHVNSRRRIAAGRLVNSTDNLMEWIVRAQQHKPGSRMPSIALSRSEAFALAAYLSILD